MTLPSLTLFSIPKAFRGHIGIIQRNAIRSWTQMPDTEVILCGDDPGVAEIAAEFGLVHAADVKRNAHGTPLLSSAFDIAHSRSRGRWIGYVNADIILPQDMAAIVQGVAVENFLLVGQRLDIKISELIDFRPGWEAELRASVKERGTLHPPTGSDYFVYPKGMIRTLPPFAVGRPGWDNWLIYHVRKRKIPLIDATGAITAVHQDHDYAHVPQGQRGTWHGPEADQNQELAAEAPRVYTLDDADWEFDGHATRRRGTFQVLGRRLRRPLTLIPTALSRRWRRLLR